MKQNLPVGFGDVQAAATRIAGVAHKTPVVTSRTVDAQCGAQLFFKCENLQRAGAFKFRGACNAVAQLLAAQQKAGVVTFSSGNHGQALALAAHLQSVPATIVMPRDAPASKIAATAAYGGEVILYDRHAESREAIAERLARERGVTLIPPFDHPHIIAGQGTAAKELLEEVGALDYLLTPLGGGGLLAGSALAARALAPHCKVIGVEPEAGNDGQQSFRLGRVVTISMPDTIADGARTLHLGELTFPIIRELVDDVVTVSDAQLIETMRFFAERMKLIVEPTGVLAAAAMLQGAVRLHGRVGVIISGGNVDFADLARLLATR